MGSFFLKRGWRLIRFFLCLLGLGTYPGTQYTVTNVKTWCQAHSLPYHNLKPITEFDVPEPNRFGEREGTKFAGKIKLPELYLAEVHDAMVIGGHNPVLVSDNTALYDDYLQTDRDLFDYSQPGDIISYDFIYSTDKIGVNLIKKKENKIDAGILLSGTDSNNYYHWIAEFLSRFWIIDKFPEYKDLPLIIDEHLHPNLLEALKLVNSDNRPLITIRYGEGYRVKKLIIPSKPVFMPPNLKKGVSLTYTHYAVSPTGIAFLREKLDVERRASNHRRKKRIYVTRRAGKYRKLLNEEEIERLFTNYGFIVVRPESLTFHEQIELFSSAEIIAGPAGAAFTNIIFSSSSAKIILLHAHTTYMWASIASIIGQGFDSVIGTCVKGTHSIEYHCDFHVDFDRVEESIRHAIQRST
jgi:hypothetical protein